MLILTRRPSEEIYIEDADGNLIRVAVLGVSGNQVRLGIDAPANVHIARSEIYKSKKHRKQHADG